MRAWVTTSRDTPKVGPDSAASYPVSHRPRRVWAPRSRRTWRAWSRTPRSRTPATTEPAAAPATRRREAGGPASRARWARSSRPGIVRGEGFVLPPEEPLTETLLLLLRRFGRRLIDPRELRVLDLVLLRILGQERLDRRRDRQREERPD